MAAANKPLTMRKLAETLRKNPSKIRNLQGLNDDIVGILIALDHPLVDFLPQEAFTDEALIVGGKTVGRHAIPDRLLTEQTYLKNSTRTIFNALPECEKTEKVYKRCAENAMLYDIPEDKRTAELCMIAVQIDGRQLSLVPEHLKTPEICRAAYAQTYDSLEYFPASLYPEQFKKPFYTLKHSRDNDHPSNVPFTEYDFDPTGCSWKNLEETISRVRFSFAWIPEELKTEELCALAVAKYPELKEYVPEKFRTSYVQAALESGQTEIFEIPPKQRTSQDYKFAIMRSPEIVSDIPLDALTEDLCCLALKCNPRLFPKIPDQKITRKLCQTFVDLYRNGGFSLPKELTKSHKVYVWEELAKISDLDIEYIPDNVKSIDLLKLLILAAPYRIRKFLKDKEDLSKYYTNSGRKFEDKFPHDIWDDDFTAHADLSLFYDFSQEYGDMVPEKYRAEIIKRISDGIASREYHCFAWSLGEFDSDFLTPEICLAAVKHDGRNLKYIPDSKKTDEICDAAYHQSRTGSIFYLPNNYKIRNNVEFVQTCRLFSREFLQGGRVYRPEYTEYESPLDFLKHFVGELEEFFGQISWVLEDSENVNVGMDYSKINPVVWFFFALYHPEEIPESILAAPFYLNSEKPSKPFNKITMRNLAKKIYSDPSVLADVDGITEGVAALILSSRPDWFKYLPDDVKTEKVYIWGADGINAPIPDKFKSAEFYKKCAESGFVIPNMDDKYKTEDICLQGLKQSSSSLPNSFVPDSFITPDFAAKAVRVRGTFIERVPVEMRTPEICLEAVKNDCDAFEYLTEDEKTEEIFIGLIHSNYKRFVTELDIPSDKISNRLVNCIYLLTDGYDLESFKIYEKLKSANGIADITIEDIRAVK